jgi:hypothetical protein
MPAREEKVAMQPEHPGGWADRRDFRKLLLYRGLEIDFFELFCYSNVVFSSPKLNRAHQ